MSGGGARGGRFELFANLPILPVQFTGLILPVLKGLQHLSQVIDTKEETLGKPPLENIDEGIVIILSLLLINLKLGDIVFHIPTFHGNGVDLENGGRGWVMVSEGEGEFFFE